MKNADEMLMKILKEVDTNKDGKIQYEGARICLASTDPGPEILMLLTLCQSFDPLSNEPMAS